MARNDVEGEWVYHGVSYHILREYLCHNFVSGLRTLKVFLKTTKPLKTLKT